MIKLTKLHDPDQYWIVRICVTVAECAEPLSSSVVRECDECGVPVWYDTAQVVPWPLSDEGKEPDGEVLLCLACTMIHMMVSKEPPKWIGGS